MDPFTICLLIVSVVFCVFAVYIVNSVWGIFSRIRKKAEFSKKHNMIKKETKENMMLELRSGKIKCHIVTNSADSYDPFLWMKRMTFFSQKPIAKEVLLLKGKVADE